MILLDAVGLRAERPGRKLFADLNLTLSTGDRLAVVGLNGCGKSTLLSILAGTADADAGVVRRGRAVTVAALDQTLDVADPGTTVAAALHAGSPAREWEVDAVAERLGLGALKDRPVDQLSGGQLKRVALTRVLVIEPDVLLLDEPTNHLDIDAIAWLEERLAVHRGALVLVTHDRHFLDRVTNRILELDRGQAYVHEGGYAAYLEGRTRRAELAEAAETKRRNLARSELAWLRRGAPARTSKPRARIEAATKVVQGRAAAPARTGELPLHAVTPRLGDQVLELHGVGHRFGERVLFRDLEYMLDPRERLGVLGVNGSGKSTLLDIMSGLLLPSEGHVIRGSTVRIASYDQRGRDLDPAVRVRDAVVGPDGVADWADAALMEAFWFGEDAQWSPIGLLSGGERRRLQLLLTLATRPNVLLLDEPTNDLDLDTLRQLEDFLEQWPGAVVAVSHDRAFLERVVSDILVLGDGRASFVAGGYEGYERSRRQDRHRAPVGGSAPAAASRRDPGAAHSGEVEAGATNGGATGGGATGGSAGQPSPSTLRHRLRAAERELDEARQVAESLRGALRGESSGEDHVQLARLGRDLSAAESALATAEERWLELASEVEERGLEI